MATFNTVSTLIGTNLADSSNITAAEHRVVELAILAFARDQWLTGDIKEIDCTDAYITANFETSGANKGLGTVGGEREGWAICNGNNGTRNRTGRVSVAWGDVTPGTGASIQPSIGGNGLATLAPPVLGGSKDAVLIAHTHKPQSLNGNNIPSQFYQTSWPNIPGGTPPELYGVESGGFFNGDVAGGFRRAPTTASAGSGDGIDKNMQPYIVTLFIQKL